MHVRRRNGIGCRGICTLFDNRKQRPNYDEEELRFMFYNTPNLMQAFGQSEQNTFANDYPSPMQAAYDLPVYELQPYGPPPAQFPQDFIQQYPMAYPQNVPGYYF